MSITTLSIVIPAYNEQERIGKTFSSLERYFLGKNISYEIILVDDGSTDRTIAVAKKYVRYLKNVRILENKQNRGKGYSVRRGMLHAKGKYRLFMDADNSVDISHLDAFLPWMDEGYDVVIGSIKLRNAQATEHAGWHRRVLGNLSKILIRILAVPDIYDTQRGFKLFSADAAEMIFPKQTIARFGFDIELLMLAWFNGFKTKELPVVWDNPSGSTVTLKAYVQTFYELVIILWNRLSGKYGKAVIVKQEQV